MNSEKASLLNFGQSLLSRVPKPFLQKSVFGFELLRTATFLGQNLLLTALVQKNKAVDPHFKTNLKMILKDLSQLLKKDSENIANGIYPLQVLTTESARHFFKRYPQILFDSWSVTKRRLEHVSKDFDMEAREYLRDVPDYFQRNFHYQTDGYLTEKSAELYEHQVEILFSGAADAMRRLILPPLKAQFPYTEGEGLHFLEVAGGTGRLTKFVKMTFPKAKITLMDLSHPYLKKAQDNLNGFTKINFVQGDSAALPFLDQQFDAVLSCFLFHELPLSERQKTLTESLRVLKPGGFLGLVDSVQQEDKQDFEFALKQFPVDFHEPFYKNYIQNPMEGLLRHAQFEQIQTQLGFFSKAVWALKPEQKPS